MRNVEVEIRIPKSARSPLAVGGVGSRTAGGTPGPVLAGRIFVQEELNG
jgi:hypothetical protein